MNAITLFWLAAAVSFGVLESITVQIVSIWLCLGAVVAAVVAYFGGSLWLSAIVFVGVSAILLLVTRPLVKNKLSATIQPTNADRIIGKDAVVTEEINSAENAGQIKIDGQIWSAKSTEIIPEGETVKIQSIEGVKAVVTK